MKPDIYSTYTPSLIKKQALKPSKKSNTKSKHNKSNSKRFYYDSSTLSDLSPNTRAEFMHLKNEAVQRQRRKDNDNRDNIFSRQESFRDLIKVRKTRRNSRKSSVKKPILNTIRESNSPVLYTSDISELSPNTRELFIKHKQVANKRKSNSGKTSSMSGKTRGSVGTRTKSKPKTKLRTRTRKSKKEDLKR